MSNNDDESVWVSDLDDYISVDQLPDDDDIDPVDDEVFRKYKTKSKRPDDICLFAGESISLRSLPFRGILPNEWRLAKHEAENALRSGRLSLDLERMVMKYLLSLGRRYAVSRYAKWEGHNYYTALTATFPHGFRALLDQFLKTEPAIDEVNHRRKIQSSVLIANASTELTAYHRTAIVQTAIHQSVYESHCPTGNFLLDKDRMRNILSLTRLHYCVRELEAHSFAELNKLEGLYYDNRLAVQRSGANRSSVVPLQKVRNWELRHLHPLTYLYPYSIRNVISRAKKHFTPMIEHPTHVIAVNELAMARCEINLMRENAKFKEFK